MENKALVISLVAVVLIGGLFFLFEQKDFTGYAVANSVQNAQEREENTLVILNWEDYIDPEIYLQFEEKTGVKIKEIPFATYNEQWDLFTANPAAYDLMIVDDYTFGELQELNEFEQLDFSKITNFKNIDGKFKNLNFDSGNKYTVPFLSGTTGLMVNTRYVKPLPDSWDVLWDEKYEGKTAILDDSKEMMTVALKKLGYSINTGDKQQLGEARNELFKQKARLMGSVDIRNALLAEEIHVGVIYSGDALYASDEKESLVYITPKEGLSLWMDNVVLPKRSQNKEAAYQFINYLLEPEVGAQLANYAWYMTPNKESMAYIDEELVSDPTIYLPKEIEEKSEWFEEVAEETQNFYEEVYTAYISYSSSANSGMGGITASI